jgi:ABC-type Zn2+ transport system substrate-binding protein/surface adhesin
MVIDTTGMAISRAPFQGRVERRLAFLDVPVDVSTTTMASSTTRPMARPWPAGQQVERVAHHLHEEQHADHRQRDGHHRDHHRAQGAEEQEHHHDDDQHRFARVLITSSIEAWMNSVAS